MAGLADVAIIALSAGIIDWLFIAPGRSLSELQLALAVYGVYHAGFYWLWDGQTPGLAALEIRVVSEAGKALAVVQALLRGAFRPAAAAVLMFTAWQGLDKPVAISAFVAGLLLVELGMMLTLPSRQTLSDFVARTLAVDVPPELEPDEEPQRAAPEAPAHGEAAAGFGGRPQQVR